MVRILGFYLLGMASHQLTNQYLQLSSAWVIILVLISFYLIFQTKLLRKWSGFFGLLSIAGLGWIVTSQFDESSQPDHLLKFNLKISSYVAEVIEQPEKMATGYRCLTEIQLVKSQNSWSRYYSKSYCYFKTKPQIQHGDVLLIHGSPKPVKSNSSSDTFNYAEYLKRKNIFFKDYPFSDELVVIGRRPYTLYHLAVDLRKWCITQIHSFVSGKNERAIATALLVGQSDELDPDLNKHYAVTGTLHVLSVSGLHTGLLYWIILILTQPLKKVYGGNHLISILTIGLLWSYALITGLSPSVLRAVVMFTLIAVSRPFGLRSNMYNTLAASAFILLLSDPWLITRIGFQLSYLAVLGIVWIHPLILRLWEPSSRMVFSGWNLTSISIAAQLTTLPITLLNFHQLPAWFIPANLLIIPLSSLALFVGLAFLPLSLIPLLAPTAGWVLSKLITLMNYITSAIGQLPLGPFADIHIHTEQAVALATLLLASERFLITRNRYWIIILMVTAFLFGLSDLLQP